MRGVEEEGEEKRMKEKSEGGRRVEEEAER